MCYSQDKTFQQKHVKDDKKEITSITNLIIEKLIHK